MLWLLLLIHLPRQEPVLIPLGRLRVPVHLVFDLLAYSGAFQLYRWQRRKLALALPAGAQAWIFLGCLAGALLGAKGLAWLEYAADFWPMRHSPEAWLGGKTIIGGLLGGWAGIEIAKKACGVRVSTGDAFVWPLLCGIAVGRIGCFLTGLPDLTCGSPTTLPRAMDFGDGVGRHPAQLYEIAFLLLFAGVLPILSRPFPARGSQFRHFLAGYLGFRFLSEFYKPNGGLYAGLSPLQWASLAGVLCACASLLKWPTDPARSMVVRRC